MLAGYEQRLAAGNLAGLPARTLGLVIAASPRGLDHDVPGGERWAVVGVVPGPRAGVLDAISGNAQRQLARILRLDDLRTAQTRALADALGALEGDK